MNPSNFSCAELSGIFASSQRLVFDSRCSFWRSHQTWVQKRFELPTWSELTRQLLRIESFMSRLSRILVFLCLLATMLRGFALHQPEIARLHVLQYNDTKARVSNGPGKNCDVLIFELYKRVGHLSLLAQSFVLIFSCILWRSCGPAYEIFCFHSVSKRH